jgi:hypothetical protein
MPTSDTPEKCEQCGHDWDPHIFVNSTGDPADGGIIVCPRKDCDCYSTFSVSTEIKDNPEVRERLESAFGPPITEEELTECPSTTTTEKDSP